MSSWCDYKTFSINYIVTSHAKYHPWEIFWGQFCFYFFFFLFFVGHWFRFFKEIDPKVYWRCQLLITKCSILLGKYMKPWPYCVYFRICANISYDFWQQYTDVLGLISICYSMGILFSLSWFRLLKYILLASDHCFVTFTDIYLFIRLYMLYMYIYVISWL